MDGIDPKKKKLIETMIEVSFQCGPINSRADDIDQEFFFDDGTVGYHLIIARRFLDDAKTVETLRTRLQKLDLINRLKKSPNKTVRLSPTGWISVTPKPN